MEKTYQIADFFNQNETVRASFTVAQREIDLHSQTFWELSYVYEGCGTCYIENSKTPVKEGDFLFALPGGKHCLISQPREEGAPLRICSILFTEEFVHSIIDSYREITALKDHSLSYKINRHSPLSIVLTDDNAKNIRHLIWLIAHEYNHYTVGSDQLIRHSLTSLLICITRLYEYQTGQSSVMVTKSSALDELLKYIRTNYGSKLSLDLLAAHMHLSREYLCRYFKKQTGKNISDFILEVRIEKAKEMLRTTSHSITDIGLYCGYPSVSSFQRSFKKVTHITPSEYRVNNS